MADVSILGPDYPIYPASVALETGTPKTIAADDSCEALYVYIDAADGGMISTDATNYQPIVGQSWELIFMGRRGRPAASTTFSILSASGTPTMYVRGL